ncbi:protein of unknown function [Methylocaldum szegediense]|uniref:Uncharacterized protein n=1 Tax=Methylocaldum szegediense TaxID=73780 RepID=A0ABM9HZC7_9GAMM|nr:protein of unknown function [Methylocaldum szegediense]
MVISVWVVSVLDRRQLLLRTPALVSALWTSLRLLKTAHSDLVCLSTRTLSFGLPS